MPREDLPERHGQGDGSNTGLGLWLAEGHSTPDLDKLAVDTDRSTKQVDVVESEANKLAQRSPT